MSELITNFFTDNDDNKNKNDNQNNKNIPDEKQTKTGSVGRSLKDSITKNLSKSVFLFLTWVVVAGGSVQQVIPCSTQYLLDKGIYIKHILGIILMFVFIMMEGGWDMDIEEQDKAPVDWSRGNAVHSLGYAFILYIIFVLSAKMKAKHNFMFFAILFIIYLINTQRRYYLDRDRIDEDQNNLLLDISYVLSGVAFILFVYGIGYYWHYKKSQVGNKFSVFRFFIGKERCASVFDK